MKGHRFTQASATFITNIPNTFLLTYIVRRLSIWSFWNIFSGIISSLYLLIKEGVLCISLKSQVIKLICLINMWQSTHVYITLVKIKCIGAPCLKFSCYIYVRLVGTICVRWMRWCTNKIIMDLVWRFPCKCELWNLQLVTPETFGCLVFVEMTQPQHNISAKLNLNEFLLEILIDIFP